MTTAPCPDSRKCARHDHTTGFNLIELQLVIFIISILAMIAIPLYQDYQVRTKISEGLNLVGPARQGIMEYHYLNGVFPVNNTQARLPINPADIHGNWLKSLEVTAIPSPGTIKLTYDSIKIARLGAKNVLLIAPTSSANGVTWDCTLGTIENQYRPKACRSD